MNNVKKISQIVLIFSGLFIGGCAGGGKSLPSISETEVVKYEQQYFSEYETLKKKYENIHPQFKMLQPNNVKEECRVFMVIDPNDDKTIKNDYKFFWDGDCKNGFAYGLGREIEITMTNKQEQIGYYENGKAIDYCVQTNKLKKATSEGECHYSYVAPDHRVTTYIDDTGFDLGIYYEVGARMTLKTPELTTKIFPFADVVEYYKGYFNFAYLISDFTKDEFDDKKYLFSIIEPPNRTYNCFSFKVSKQNQILAGEIVGGTLIRTVQLPQSYISKASTIYEEIRSASNMALEAQKKALIIKENYVNKICKEEIKVSFMDNEEYKLICQEDEIFAVLKTKIDAKLAQIDLQKKQKRDQINNQNRVIAQQQLESQKIQQENYNNTLNQLTQIGNNMSQAGNQALQQSSTFAPPSIAPLNINPLNNRNTRVRNCYTLGGIEYCR